MPESRGYVVSSDKMGSVNICQSVVAVIAAAAAIDVDGVHGLCQSSRREVTTTNNTKGLWRCVKLHVDGDSTSVDVNLIAESDYSISEVAEAVQSAIKSAIEEAVGIAVENVNVTVSGVSLKTTQEA